MTTPTTTFRYGLLAPTLNADLVKEQMYKALNYQNKFIKVERERRDVYRGIIKNCGEVERLDNECKALKKRCIELNNRNKKLNSDARKKVVSEEMKQEYASAKKLEKMKREQLNEARALKTPEAMDDIVANNRTAVLKNNVIRTSGVAPWHGTYSLMEKSFKQIREMPMYDGIEPNNPKFRSSSRSNGRIGIAQFKPLEPVSKMFDTDSISKHVQIITQNMAVKFRRNGNECRKSKNDYRLFRMRIGTIKGTQNPIWAEFPIFYHREIPQDALISVVQVIRKRIGPREKWTVSITVEPKNKLTAVSNGKENVVAFDLGWRQFDDRVRVACWSGSDGRKGEIAVPQNLLDKLHKVEQISSGRDKDFDKIKQELISWKDNNENNLPDWLKEKSETLEKWKSQARLVSLIRFWQSNRFAGDEEIMGVSGYWENKQVVGGTGLLSWRYHDHHLWQWERSQQVKAIGQRQQLYKILAKRFSQEYDVVVFENINLANLAKGKVGSKNRQLTAPSEFRNACKAAFEVRGKKYEEVSARNTSKKCDKCGTLNTIGGKLEYICSGCKELLDRDENAADVILHRYENGERCLGKQTTAPARKEKIVNEIKELA